MKPKTFTQPFLRYFKLILGRAGFTLIELLIVVTTMAVLAAIMYPQFQGIIIRSRLKELYSTVEIIKAAERYYYEKKGEYYIFKRGGTATLHTYAEAEAALNIDLPGDDNLGSAFCTYQADVYAGSLVIDVYTSAKVGGKALLFQWNNSSDSRQTYRNIIHPYYIYITADNTQDIGDGNP